jgi:hypothetical protein
LRVTGKKGIEPIEEFGSRNEDVGKRQSPNSKAKYQGRGLTPIGMLGRWNIGKMGFVKLACQVNSKIRLDEK